MTTLHDSEEESLPLPTNNQPRRFARNPRRGEGYERDSSYVGTTDDDIARIEAEREARLDRPLPRIAGMSPVKTAKFFAAVDQLFFREEQLEAVEIGHLLIDVDLGEIGIHQMSGGLVQTAYALLSDLIAIAREQPDEEER